jgi:hypothetical protein
MSNYEEWVIHLVWWTVSMLHKNIKFKAKLPGTMPGKDNFFKRNFKFKR